MGRKTVIDLFQLMCPTLHMGKPQVVFSSTDADVIKLTAFLHEALDDIKSEHEWQFLRREHLLTTVPAQADYDFPADIDHFISATFYDRTNRWDVPGSLTAQEWQDLKAWELGYPFYRFTIAGDKIKFYPTPTEPVSLACEYVSNAVVTSSGGTFKSQATEDSDIILFDHRLVIALIKFKWRDALGEDTSSAADDYDDFLSSTKAQDVPRRVINAAGSCNTTPFVSTLNWPEYL